MSWAGSPPRDLGLIDLTFDEMLFWMYCPISVPHSHDFTLPDSLQQFWPIVDAVREDDPASFFLRYVYLTAKTLWVEGGYIGNRPGWHIDGYGTSDVNYIWADRAPTEFLCAERGWELSDDCDESMHQMEKIGRFAEAYNFVGLRTYPDKHLLRLDDKIIHRSPAKFGAGLRTFVKVSTSRDRYNLKGNSVNHRLPETHWPLVDRRAERNHPAKEAT